MDISSSAFSRAISGKVGDLRARASLTEALTLENKLKEFEQHQGHSTYDVYKKSDGDIQEFINDQKRYVAANDPDFREKKKQALASLDSQIATITGSEQVPGNLDRQAALEVMNLLEQRRVTELDYDGGLGISYEKRVLEKANGQTLHDIHARKNRAAERAGAVANRTGLAFLIPTLISSAAGIAVGCIHGGGAGFLTFMTTGMATGIISGGVVDIARSIQSDRMAERDTIEVITKRMAQNS